MQLFFVKNIESNLITLSEEESKHAVKVLRKTVGDILYVIDGQGGMYKAEIVNPNHRGCTASIIETIKEYEKLPYHLHVVIAPTKNIDRTEWFMEKATEIGIAEFTMLLTEHSERKVVNDERLEKVIISAVKQSIKAYKPQLNSICTFKDFVTRDFGDYQCYIAHCSENFERIHLKELVLSGENSIIMIGPEGDFSDTEIKLALDHGFKSISLGNSRLRTETAALFATSIVALKNQ